MYSLNVNSHQYNNYNTVKFDKTASVKKEEHATNPNVAFTSNSTMTQVPYNPALTAGSLRTELVSKDEKNKFNQLSQIVGKKERKNLQNLLKSGALLNSDSNDKSTTLDNLYKIVSTKRAQGIDGLVILQDTINTLADPHVITQQFGNIPQKFKQQVERTAGDRASEINVDHSGTCVASSIEFNLADKHPAEFARFAEGLSSSKMAVDKTIQLSNLSENTLDAIWLLNAFEIPYTAKDFNNAKLTFAPDKDAVVRAYFQAVDRDYLERSSLDVLMQSTFMQVGSQQSYNSLIDKRAGKFNQNDKGLIEFEKTFTESVVENKNKISVTYQKVDEDARLTGYETDFNTMKKQITDALKLGQNVIIGYTQVDDNNIIINGHEITITGTKIDNQGKMIFICNDTDDNVSKSVEYSEDFLLPKIHHAALPQEVVADDVQLVENWVEGLRMYKKLKQEQAQNSKPQYIQVA